MKLDDALTDLMFLSENGFELKKTPRISESYEFLNVIRNKTELTIFYTDEGERSSIHSFSDGLAFCRPDWTKHVVKSEFDLKQREVINLIQSILENGAANEIG